MAMIYLQVSDNETVETDKLTHRAIKQNVNIILFLYFIIYYSIIIGNNGMYCPGLNYD